MYRAAGGTATVLAGTESGGEDGPATKASVNSPRVGPAMRMAAPMSPTFGNHAVRASGGAAPRAPRLQRRTMAGVPTKPDSSTTARPLSAHAKR